MTDDMKKETDAIKDNDRDEEEFVAEVYLFEGKETKAFTRVMSVASLYASFVNYVDRKKLLAQDIAIFDMVASGEGTVLSPRLVYNVGEVAYHDSTLLARRLHERAQEEGKNISDLFVPIEKIGEVPKARLMNAVRNLASCSRAYEYGNSDDHEALELVHRMQSLIRQGFSSALSEKTVDKLFEEGFRRADGQLLDRLKKSISGDVNAKLH